MDNLSGKIFYRYPLSLVTLATTTHQILLCLFTPYALSSINQEESFVCQKKPTHSPPNTTLVIYLRKPVMRSSYRYFSSGWKCSERRKRHAFYCTSYRYRNPTSQMKETNPMSYKIVQLQSQQPLYQQSAQLDTSRNTAILIRQSRRGSDKLHIESRMLQESLIPFVKEARAEEDLAHIHIFDEGSGVSGTKGVDRRK